MKKKKQINSDHILSISAIIIAIVSIITGIWQGSETRKHNRLSVRPRLNLHYSCNYDNQTVSFMIINNGLGPAIIKKVFYEYNSQEYQITNETEIGDVLELIEMKNIPISFEGYGPGNTITADEKCTIFRIEMKYLKNLSIELDELMNVLQFKVVYSSLYGEEFVCYHPEHD